MASNPGDQRGFTLLEMLFALTVVALLTSLGTIGLRRLEAALAPRTLARQVASTLRLGRSQAVAGNREMRVRFFPEGELSDGQPAFFLQRGNLPQGSTSWEDCPKNKVAFSSELALGISLNCQNRDGYISFNPDGSSNALYVCILARDERRSFQKRYAVGVSHATTGRIRILKWNPGKDRFE